MLNIKLDYNNIPYKWCFGASKNRIYDNIYPKRSDNYVHTTSRLILALSRKITIINDLATISKVINLVYIISLI